MDNSQNNRIKYGKDFINEWFRVSMLQGLACIYLSAIKLDHVASNASSYNNAKKSNWSQLVEGSVLLGSSPICLCRAQVNINAALLKEIKVIINNNLTA